MLSTGLGNVAISRRRSKRKALFSLTIPDRAPSAGPGPTLLFRQRRIPGHLGPTSASEEPGTLAAGGRRLLCTGKPVEDLLATALVRERQGVTVHGGAPPLIGRVPSERCVPSAVREHPSHPGLPGAKLGGLVVAAGGVDGDGGAPLAVAALSLATPASCLVLSGPACAIGAP